MKEQEYDQWLEPVEEGVEEEYPRDTADRFVDRESFRWN